MESVDVSIIEGRSIYLEGSLGGPWRALVAIQSRPVLWNLLEEIHRDVWKYSNTPVAGDPNEGSGLLNRCFWSHRINCYY